MQAFKEHLQHDWNTLAEAALGAASLGELLSWIEIRHRREQAKVCEALVGKFTDVNFPLVSVIDWSKLSTQVSIVKQAHAQSSVCGVVVIDFNTPAARDALKMPSMVAAAAECIKVLGATASVLLAVMPNVPKENSKTSAFEDEIAISKLLAKAGFSTQERVRQMVDMPLHVSNKVSQLDWWVDLRMCCLGDPKDNWLMQGSELYRTRAVFERAVVTDPDDLIDVVSLEADEDLNTGERYQDVNAKVAQRGVFVAKAQVAALLAKSKRGEFEWIKPSTKVLVLDMTPFVGDRAMASLSMLAEPVKQCSLVHIIVQVGKGASAKHGEFTSKRVKQTVAAQWFEDKIELKDDHGRNVKFVTVVPEPSPAELKMLPGAAIAHKGLRQLDLSVCVLSGNRVQIRPDKLAVFASASTKVIAALDALKKTHEARYSSLLECCVATVTNSAGETLDDHRPRSDDAQTAKEVTVESEDMVLSNLDSVEVLKVNFTVEDVASPLRGVKLFRDTGKKAVFLLAKDETVVKPGEHIGGIGGGTILDADPSKSNAVPWSLPLGDKTWVQRVSEKGADCDDGSKKKFVSGTLYSVLRELERRSTQPVVLSSFGEVSAASESGRQQYKFKNEPGTENFRSIEYVLSAPRATSKLSHANFFAPFVSREAGLGEGALQLTWRLTYDSVAGTLKPSKVFVTARTRIVLPKGKPVKVCWAKVA